MPNIPPPESAALSSVLISGDELKVKGQKNHEKQK
jgi:hypothetical protein